MQLCFVLGSYLACLLGKLIPRVEVVKFICLSMSSVFRIRIHGFVDIFL